MAYWLIKTEASCYSINDLKRDKIAPWTGIRNYQARNFMRDDMRPGDYALFYHSNGSTQSPAGVYGVAKVSGKAYPDPTQFDMKDEHYDPKATIATPIWVCVDMKFVKKFKAVVTLTELKKNPTLRDMAVCQRGTRLSVLPVAPDEFETVTKLADSMVD